MIHMGYGRRKDGIARNEYSYYQHDTAMVQHINNVAKPHKHCDTSTPYL